MEFSVKEIKETITEKVGEEKTTKFTTKFESIDGEMEMTIKELENCSFHKGDLYEFKRLESQTTVKEAI